MSLPGQSGEPSYLTKHRLNSDLFSIESEIASIDADITKLQSLRASLVEKQQVLLKEIQGSSLHHHQSVFGGGDLRNGKGKATTVDYFEPEFEWSGGLKDRMRRVFGIQSFRLCQEGVCNANMDSRDIVCVMPTGGGKSLTYQLPALLTPGCTLVISPLISLITDQILHLQEVGVEAVMLTGTTSKEMMKDIMIRLNPNAQRSQTMANNSQKEIKLCYVTPEKIAKSKAFMSLLEKMSKAGRLARIVIDEAHCVSQVGHDFRPDYKKLSILRQLFPRVPIMALSATCPPNVLNDLLLTLRLGGITDGRAANLNGTVYFTAPLYRKNLHYKVLPKPASSNGVIQAMCDYIIQCHNNEAGIVYCLSKKDTEAVAQGLQDASGGKIKTGVYHSDCPAHEKEILHKNWRLGTVKVVCATIAFGLGIDKGDVRFVLHHSMSKSLDGFYQESGRAGRDGQDSDCVLYYRPQDASRLSALVCGEVEGQDKLHSMLNFAQNVTDCRKILFANYFSSSSSLASSSWSADETDDLTRCGHCDNCIRAPEEVSKKNVSTEAWQILRVVQSIQDEGGRVTIGILADLVRGAGGASFSVSHQGRGRKRKSMSKDKVDLDLERIAGGKVALGKDETEALIVDLLLKQYLQEEFSTTAYAINVYMITGQNALRLTRYTRDAIADGNGPTIEFQFLKRTSNRSAARKTATTADKIPARSKLPVFQSPWPPQRKKITRHIPEESFDLSGIVSDLDVDDLPNEDTCLSEEIIELSDDDDLPIQTPVRSTRRDIVVAESSEDEGRNVDFTFTLDDRPLKKSRLKARPVVEVIDVSP